MARQSESARKPNPLPVHGPIDHNAGLYLAIGSLIVNWANNESVFLAMLQVLIRGDDLSASTVWFSQRTTSARLELLLRLCRQQVKDSQLLGDVRKAVKQFKGFSRIRNFYCHSRYQYDEQFRLVSAVGATLSDDGDPLRFESKPFSTATKNEITDTLNKLTAFNRDTWDLVSRLQSSLGVQRVRVPKLPPQT